MTKISSPYTAAVTGGGFLFEETDALLPLFMAPNSSELIKNEKVNNRLLHINSETSRSRFIHEMKRRYETMPREFWEEYIRMSEEDRRAALLYVILKTYKIAFDFHINVTLKKWRSISKQIENSDFMIEFNEISAKDEFVDSWSDNTKGKIASTYITILRKAGMCDKNGCLQVLKIGNLEFYLTGLGEPWFLEAALLEPYQIENLKKNLS